MIHKKKYLEIDKLNMKQKLAKSVYIPIELILRLERDVFANRSFSRVVEERIRHSLRVEDMGTKEQKEMLEVIKGEMQEPMQKDIAKTTEERAIKKMEVYQINQIPEIKALKKATIDMAPKEFSTKTAQDLFKKLGLTREACTSWLKREVKKGNLERVAMGYYKKLKPELKE